MAEAKQNHNHPDYDQPRKFHGEMWAYPGTEIDQRVKALEEHVKKLQKEMQDLKHKLETHDHPHTH